jgi:hypothetical protein
MAFARKICFGHHLVVVKAATMQVKAESGIENGWSVPLARKRVAEAVASHENH